MLDEREHLISPAVDPELSKLYQQYKSNPVHARICKADVTCAKIQDSRPQEEDIFFESRVRNSEPIKDVPLTEKEMSNLLQKRLLERQDNIINIFA